MLDTNKFKDLNSHFESNKRESLKDASIEFRNSGEVKLPTVATKKDIDPMVKFRWFSKEHLCKTSGKIIRFEIDTDTVCPYCGEVV